MPSTVSRKRPGRATARRQPKTPALHESQSGASVADMTRDELQEMIAATVEGKLVQWFGDPEDVRDEQEWARQFARSQSALERLADEGLAELAAGKTEPLDPDHL